MLKIKNKFSNYCGMKYCKRCKFNSDQIEIKLSDFVFDTDNYKCEICDHSK